MKTYVLTKLSCAKKPSGLRTLLGIAPKVCHCSMNDMRRRDLCAVRAVDPKSAAILLGGTHSGLSLGPMFQEVADFGIWHCFVPGDGTYDVVASVHPRLRQKTDSIQVANLLSAFACAVHEANLRTALKDDVHRSKFYLVAVPEVGETTQPYRAVGVCS